MKSIKFASLGMIALAMSLGGCSPYKYSEEVSYEVADKQTDVSITLGEAFQTALYNVKQPIEVTLNAPEKHKIIIDNKEYSSYQVKINPQEAINKSFYIRTEQEKPTLIATHITTYKETFSPKNRTDYSEVSGKTRQVVGKNIYYNLNNNPKEVTVELHEFNKKRKHNFYYLNGTNDITIKLIAPKYTSFVFENGTKQKEYSLNLSRGETINFLMNLSQDNASNTYERIYKFSRN